MNDTPSAPAPAAQPSKLAVIEAKAAAIIQAAASDIEQGCEFVVETVQHAEKNFTAWKQQNPVLAELAANAAQLVLGRLQVAGIPVAVAESLAGEILTDISDVATKAAVHSAT